MTKEELVTKIEKLTGMSFFYLTRITKEEIEQVWLLAVEYHKNKKVKK